MSTAATDVADPTDSRCGGCGYAVAGLPTPVCPECGADLRVVGVVTGRDRRGFRWRVARVSAWIAVMVMLAMASRAVEPRLPLPREIRQQRAIFCYPAGHDGFSEMVWASASAHGVGTSRFGSTPPPLRAVTLHRGADADTTRDLHVDWATKAFHYTAGGRTVSQADGFGPGALLAWLAAGGRPVASVDTDTARQQAADVVAAVDAMPRSAGRFTPFAGSRGIGHPTVVFAEPAPWFQIAIAVAWLVTLAAGAALLGRKPAR